MRNHFLYIFLGLTLNVSFSQEQKTTETSIFSLEEAIAFALENNYSALKCRT